MVGNGLTAGTSGMDGWRGVVGIFFEGLAAIASGTSGMDGWRGVVGIFFEGLAAIAGKDAGAGGAPLRQVTLLT
jgi:hypothetical protein